MILNLMMTIVWHRAVPLWPARDAVAWQAEGADATRFPGGVLKLRAIALS